MKISSKLVVLIGLSILMIVIQFGIGGYSNSRMSGSIRTATSLGKISDSFLNAVIEERSYINSHDDRSLQSAMRYLKETDEGIVSLESGSNLGAENLRAFESMLAAYRDRLTSLAKVIQEMDSIRSEFKEAVDTFNRKAEKIEQKLNEEIGSRLVNVQEVPEQFRAFEEITTRATLLVNWSFLTLSQDLMLRNDIDAYLDRSKELEEQLQTSKKNVVAICRFVKGQQYSDFVYQTVIRTIDRIPAQTAKLHDLWKEKTSRQYDLDEIRKQAMALEAKVLDESAGEINRLRNRLLWTSVAAICITICAVFLVGVGILRSISRPITRLTGIAAEVAKGDLRKANEQLGSTAGPGGGGRKPGVDEIGRLSAAFVLMVESLHSLIGHVRNSGIRVVSSATEISASARELEASAAQQAASVNQASVTSRQISASSRELVRTMGQVASVASDTAALAQEGQSGLKDMEATMGRMMDATGSIASKLEIISEKTNNIGSVVTTINKVSDQTNLLSLNAAIEAEKAGEYGMGFSVVAREIRRLADQTAVATLDIEQMVKEMQSAVSSGVMEVDKFVQQVRHGVDSIARIGGQLASVIEQVQHLIPGFEEVKRAMEEQSSSAEEISGAMLQLSEGAEQTRQVVSEFNRVVRELTDAVGVLQTEVSRFQLEATGPR